MLRKIWMFLHPHSRRQPVVRGHAEARTPHVLVDKQRLWCAIAPSLLTTWRQLGRPQHLGRTTEQELLPYKAPNRPFPWQNEQAYEIQASTTRNETKRSQCWSEQGQEVEFNRNLDEIGRSRPAFGRNQLGSAELSPNLVDIRQIRPNIAQSWSKSTRVGRT